MNYYKVIFKDGSEKSFFTDLCWSCYFDHIIKIDFDLVEMIVNSDGEAIYGG